MNRPSIEERGEREEDKSGDVGLFEGRVEVLWYSSLGLVFKVNGLVCVVVLYRREFDAWVGGEKWVVCI